MGAEDAGQGGLPAPGWPPEDHRRESTALVETTERTRPGRSGAPVPGHRRGRGDRSPGRPAAGRVAQQPGPLRPQSLRSSVRSRSHAGVLPSSARRLRRSSIQLGLPVPSPGRGAPARWKRRAGQDPRPASGRGLPGYPPTGHALHGADHLEHAEPLAVPQVEDMPPAASDRSRASRWASARSSTWM